MHFISMLICPGTMVDGRDEVSGFIVACSTLALLQSVRNACHSGTILGDSCTILHTEGYGWSYNTNSCYETYCQHNDKIVKELFSLV